MTANRVLVLTFTHALTAVACFGLGIYMLPILTAPDSPELEVLRSIADEAVYIGEFRRDLEDSDPFHWGEGTLYVGATEIAMQGRLAPGPDYRLYLSPVFVETAAEFEALKAQMVQVGHVRTFADFAVEIPESVDPADYNSAIVWCESFAQFITAARYR